MNNAKYFYVVYTADVFLSSIVMSFNDDFKIAEAHIIAKSYQKENSAPIILSWKEITFAQYIDFGEYTAKQNNSIYPKIAEVVQLKK